MHQGVIAVGLLLVIGAVVWGVGFTPAPDAWGVWFGLGVTVGVGGALVGCGAVAGR